MAHNHITRDRLTALAVRMKRGDRRAAEELYDDLLPKVHGFIFARTGKRETAEDLAHDVFIKLIERIDSYDEARGAFVVWFWQVVRRMLIDFYRKKSELTFSQFNDDDVEAMAVDNRAPVADDRFRHEKVMHFVASLGEEEQELFELRFVAELSYGEIAGVLGKSEGALRVASLRLRDKIKKGLKNV